MYKTFRAAIKGIYLPTIAMNNLPALETLCDD